MDPETGAAPPGDHLAVIPGGHRATQHARNPWPAQSRPYVHDGRQGGRPPGLDPRRVRHARQLYDSGETVSEIAKVLKVSRATVYRHLEESRKSEPEDS